MVFGVGTTHHVKIGDDYFLVRQGSYVKRAAPTFGARFATGDPDYNNLSFWQYWVQHCWVGGIGAETWQDDSMFHEGVGVMTLEHEKMTLARGLSPQTSRSTGNWDMGGQTYERRFVQFNGKLYVISLGSANDSKLYRYNDSTATWTLVATFTSETSVRSVAAWSGKLWIGTSGANLRYMNPDETFGSLAKPAGRTETPWAMRVFRNHMYVGFGRYLWRMKSDETWDGSTAFFDAIGVDRFESMEQHLGFLYVSSANGHILRTDGNATFDLWQFDPGARPRAMRSYDGRLFVQTVEYDSDTLRGQGVLYQFTGSAVTELKRWGVDDRDTGVSGMVVAFRRLFFGASNLLGMGRGGFGIAAYDALEDAYSVVASFQATGKISPGAAYINYIISDIVYWNGYLMVSVNGHGIFRTPWRVPKTDQLGRVTLLAEYDTSGGWYSSSDFDGGTPGLMKLWKSIRVQADLPSAATSIKVDYSTDGGKIWNTAGFMTRDSAAQRFNKEFFLENVRSTRIKYRIWLLSTAANVTPTLLSVTVPYLPQPEPNWQWEMWLVMATDKELLDGSVDTEDVDAVKGRLEQAFRDQELVAFTDAEGESWEGVLIHDYQAHLRYIGAEADGDIEGDVRVVLLEAVDQYGA